MVLFLDLLLRITWLAASSALVAACPPRVLVVSGSGRELYTSLNSEGRFVKFGYIGNFHFSSIQVHPRHIYVSHFSLFTGFFSILFLYFLC